MQNIFGTDGVRGTANKYPMTPDNILKLGMAAAIYFNQRTKLKTNRVIVAKDPRLSGYLFETAITSGLLSMGKEVFLVGPMPTPGLAFLSKTMRADFGVMISASHNLYYDNGIKLFDSEGFKLFKSDEHEIELIMSQDLIPMLPPSDKIGRAARLQGADSRYVQYVKSIFPNSLSLSDVKIVLDCANGASYKVAPNVLYELGATNISAIGISPNGLNINDGFGSTYAGATVAKVLETGADVGISLDGDADRLVMVDEKGEILDGDTILAIIATYWKKRGRLKNNKVVGTILSNMGLEKYLESIGIDFIRTDVGDKHIIECLKHNKLNLGAESSGHIVLLDYNTTSDGLLSCLEVIRIMLEEDLPLSYLNSLIKKIPQKVTNVQVASKSIIEDPVVQKFIKDKQEKYKNKARIIVRLSGTEPLIRVLVEGENIDYIESINKEISLYLKQKNHEYD